MPENIAYFYHLVVLPCKQIITQVATQHVVQGCKHSIVHEVQHNI